MLSEGMTSATDGSSIGDLGDCLTSSVTYDEPSPKWSEIHEGKESKVGLTVDLWDIQSSKRENERLLTVLRRGDHRQDQGRKAGKTTGSKN